MSRATSDIQMQYEKNVCKHRAIVCESGDIYIVVNKKRSLSDSVMYLKNKAMNHKYLSDKLCESEFGDINPLKATIGTMDNSPDKLKQLLFTKNFKTHTIRHVYEERRQELAFEYENTKCRWSTGDESPH